MWGNTVRDHHQSSTAFHQTNTLRLGRRGWDTSCLIQVTHWMTLHGSAWATLKDYPHSHWWHPIDCCNLFLTTCSHCHLDEPGYSLIILKTRSKSMESLWFVDESTSWAERQGGTATQLFDSVVKKSGIAITSTTDHDGFVLTLM